MQSGRTREQSYGCWHERARFPLAADVRVAREPIAEQITAAGIDGSDDPDFGTLVASECGLQERLCRIMRAARWADKQAEALASMIAEMQERKKRLEAKGERLKGVVLWALQEAGLPRLDAPDLSATVAKGKPPLVITVPAEQLPDTVCRIKREPDKAKVRSFIEAGLQIEGVSLGNPAPYLTARWK
jgi:hypothetical protein